MIVPLAETTEVLETLAALVRLGRRTRRWSQAELAERVGVSRDTVRKVEAADPSVSVGTFLNAAVLVGVPLLGPDDVARKTNSRLVEAELALLPARVHDLVIDDEF